MTIPSRTLNDGHTLPAIGFGTWPLRGEEAVSAIVSALDVGYRLLDSAVNYENEAGVGTAIRRSDVPREDILVTTKVPGRSHERALAISSVEESLRRMRLDVLDLVLVHWPNPGRGRPERQRANLDVFGFTLTREEVDAVTALGRPDGRLFDSDPQPHEEL
jgi:2,5-diketo-D-gluconate reductase A